MDNAGGAVASNNLHLPVTTTVGNSGGLVINGGSTSGGGLTWGSGTTSTFSWPDQSSHSFAFSKTILEQTIKEFKAGKYTRKYIETYLDFMVMNAMLDNLEYLEYKVSLDKE